MTINGYDWAVAPAPFENFLEPQLTGLSPSFGPASGGVRVTVTGMRFPGEGHAMWCRFGVATVPALRAFSDSVVCMTPAGPPGNVTLEVSVNSLDFTSAGLRFAYRSPAVVIAEVPASNGSNVNGSNVTRRRLLTVPAGAGEGGDGGTLECLFGGRHVPARLGPDGFVCDDSELMDANSELMDADSDDTLGDFLSEFLEEAVVSRVAPLSGPASGGTLLIVSGGGLDHGGPWECAFLHAPPDPSSVTSVHARQPRVLGSSPLVMTPASDGRRATCLAPLANASSLLPASSTLLEIRAVGDPSPGGALFRAPFAFYRPPRVASAEAWFGPGGGLDAVLVRGDRFRDSPAFRCRIFTVDGGEGVEGGGRVLSDEVAVCDVGEAPVGGWGEMVEVGVANNGVDFSEGGRASLVDAMSQAGARGCAQETGVLVAAGRDWAELPEGVCSADATYDGYTLLILDGPAAGSVAHVRSYDPSRRRLTLEPFSSEPACVPEAGPCARYSLVPPHVPFDRLAIELRVTSPHRVLHPVLLGSLPRLHPDAGPAVFTQGLSGLWSGPPRGVVSVAPLISRESRAGGATSAELEGTSGDADPASLRGVLQSVLAPPEGGRKVSVVAQVTDQHGSCHVQVLVVPCV